MTKAQFMKKTRGLIKTTNAEIFKKAKVFIDSGAVDFADYENNFILPKIFMAAACQDMAWQWRPLSDKYRKIVENVKHFI
jgi:hypothetical protein